MVLSGHTVLVTGGGSGIGLAIARRFLAAGSTVIACGRDSSRLNAATRTAPGLVTRQADVSDASARRELVAWMAASYPAFDVLVNNAGIQRRVGFAADAAPWDERRLEIAINFEAPLHLATLARPYLAARPGSAIWNVTSGLAFAPARFAPVYSATKAALHSATLTLRVDYEPLGILVVEIIPPAVDTGLGGAGVHRHGVPVEAFVDAVVARIVAGEVEVGYGTSEARRLASRDRIAEISRAPGTARSR